MKKLNLLIVLISFVIFGCKKNEPIDNPKITNDIVKIFYSVSEINFSLMDEKIYTQSDVTILMDKQCNIDSVKVMVEDKEAKIISSSKKDITIKFPDFFKDTVSLYIQDKNTKKIVKEKIKVFPSNLSFEEVSSAPYEARFISNYFMFNEKGCIQGGKKYLGYDSTKTPDYVFVDYNDLWEYDNKGDKWNSLDSIIGLSSIDKLRFYNASKKIIVNNEVFIVTNQNLNKLYFSNLNFQRFNCNNGQWDILYNQEFMNLDRITFIYYENNKLNIGLKFTYSNNNEIWCFDLEEKTFKNIYKIPFVEDNSWDAWLNLIFKHGSILYFSVNSTLSMSRDYAKLDGPQIALYLFNTEQNELRKINLENLQINSLNNSPTFNFGDFGIIGEGIATNGVLYKYSNKYYKVCPK